MKKIILSEGREIETPWLTIAEAATYCGVSRSYINDHADEIKHSVVGRSRKFKSADLDEWVEKKKGSGDLL